MFIKILTIVIVDKSKQVSRSRQQFPSGSQPAVRRKGLRRQMIWRKDMPADIKQTTASAASRVGSYTGSILKSRTGREDHPRPSRWTASDSAYFHTRLNTHVNKYEEGFLPTCPCCQEDQTTGHVLQGCPLRQETRQRCGRPLLTLSY